VVIRSAAAAIAVAWTVSGLLAQADVSSAVARAGAYVEAFQRDFGLVVAEERYQQDIIPSTQALLLRGRVSELPVRSVMRSDFLLVRTDQGSWMPFRDVFELNGTPVRDREDRLTALFLNNQRSAIDQARKIMEESSRYNIGGISRNINLPTLALDFLTAPLRGRFAFTEAGRDGALLIIAFTEQGRPTYVKTTGDRDLPVSGRYWVDELTGRVERTELNAVDTSIEAHITVTYRPDATAGIWVPARMEEKYKQRGSQPEVTGVATYSNFRRFQVKTSEEVVQ
jgi:hypothetical protein